MEYLPLAISVSIPFAGGFLGNLLSAAELKRWYPNLKKPSWTPPNWIFGPAWSALYLSMGVASWLIWKKGGFEKQTVPLLLYGSQLLTNFLWTPLFFGAHKMGLAMLDILLMDLLTAGCIATFYPVDSTAGLLMVPYLCWITFATFLNYKIWCLNPEKRKKNL
eukprot:TRINITY_DN12078_c0_g1_i1.p1 TRINITY_DN12078_c0_g1~~TRINITY_DN12078_c0_g1_i1.p1  ORF type:complete len:163 (+),score=26.09 TRINITY_DN12078_c0_g1_i1:182-670(+)